MKRVLLIFIAAIFLVTGLGHFPLSAQSLDLPAPGTRLHLSPAFNPPLLKGIKVDPQHPLKFEFIVSRGDLHSGTSREEQQKRLKEEGAKLIKYFLASITTPEKDLWVNLSPYEKDRIVPEGFGQTEMGRDLLAQDYLLKQISASLLYPEEKIGKSFWQKVYHQAAARFGSAKVPVQTFNKVWVMPEKIVVYENTQTATAYIVESSLKVMLDADYLALSKRGQGTDVHRRLLQEIMIPILTKEVNEGKHFAQLRQVYHSLILATWYTKKIKDSIFAQVYAGKNKVAGVNIDDPQEKQKIYERYLLALKKGAYNYIKQEEDPVTHQPIPRKYFSGGADLVSVSHAMLTTSTFDSAQLPADPKDFAILAAEVNPLGISDNSMNAEPAVGISPEAWPMTDAKSTQEFLLNGAGARFFAAAKQVEVILERGQVRFSSLENVAKQLRFVFPQLAPSITEWEKSSSQKKLRYEDYVPLSFPLVQALRSHWGQYETDLLQIATTMDYLLKYFDPSVNSLEATQDYLEHMGSLSELEDGELRPQFEAVVDQLADIYELDAQEVRIMKEATMVVRGRNPEDVQDRDIDYVIELLKALHSAPGENMLKFREQMLLAPISTKIDVFKKLLEPATRNLLSVVASELLERRLRSIPGGGKFGAVASNHYKHLVSVVSENNHEALISEAGHLFLYHLAGFGVDIDHGVSEAFDALARIAFDTRIADYYQTTGRAIYDFLKSKSAFQLWQDRRRLFLERMADDQRFLYALQPEPTFERNTVEALRRSPEIVRSILQKHYTPAEITDMLRADPNIVTHSIGIYLARQMVEKAGSPKKAILVAKEMLKESYKPWLADFKEFMEKFEEFQSRLDGESFGRQQSASAAMITRRRTPLTQPNIHVDNDGNINIRETENRKAPGQGSHSILPEEIIKTILSQKEGPGEPEAVFRMYSQINSPNTRHFENPTQLEGILRRADDEWRVITYDPQAANVMRRKEIIRYSTLRQAADQKDMMKRTYVILDDEGNIVATKIDAAQRAHNTLADGAYGGIDLKPDPMNILSSGAPIQFRSDPAMIERLQNAMGFEPVNLEIRPMSDLRLYLGLKNSSTTIAKTI